MTERDLLRAACPITARLTDDLRSVFGDGVRVVYVNEGGTVRGSRGRNLRRFLTTSRR
jgi:hypothetical protein